MPHRSKKDMQYAIYDYLCDYKAIIVIYFNEIAIFLFLDLVVFGISSGKFLSMSKQHEVMDFSMI